MNILFLAAFALGIGTVVFTAVYSLCGYLQASSSPFYRSAVSSRLKGLRSRRIDAERSDEEKRNSAITVVGALGGAVFGLLLTLGTGVALIATVIGSVLGVGVLWFVRYISKEAKKTKTMRELAVLYELITFFTQGGDDYQHFTIQQALRYGAVITPTIRPIVQRCIDAWPSGPIRALENFAKEVNLPEASTLSSVLIHAEKGGMKYARDAIAEGSHDLEELRQMLAEIKIGSRPLYYTIYRMMPLAGAIGIVGGAGLNHLMIMLTMFFNF